MCSGGSRGFMIHGPLVWFVRFQESNGSGFMVHDLRGVVVQPVLERVES